MSRFSEASSGLPALKLLLGGLFHDVEGRPVQVERRLLSRPYDFRIYVRQELPLLPSGGFPPLDLVTSGTQDGLLTVRRFLDNAFEGRYMPTNELDVGFSGYDEADLVIRRPSGRSLSQREKPDRIAWRQIYGCRNGCPKLH